jgi:hypothetical protein
MPTRANGPYYFWRPRCEAYLCRLSPKHGGEVLLTTYIAARTDQPHLIGVQAAAPGARVNSGRTLQTRSGRLSCNRCS